jgi:hypothetical protein
MKLPPSPTAYSHVPSPCIGVCRMNDEAGWCEGCLRTREEITVWGKMADRDKLALWKRLTQRRKDLPTPASRPHA